MNEFAPSSFMDFTQPISTGGSVWGTKFFDPATIGVPEAPAADPLAAIPPSNPYYKPAASSMAM
jgi:hypothetical protein